MKTKTLYALLILCTVSIQAQTKKEDCKCCTENHTKFDFWVGDWVVKDTTGKIVGENKINKIQDKCAIQENWTSASGTTTGTSFNYYDSNDDTWNQIWVDNQGSQLVLKGKPSENKMVLKSKMLKGKKIAFYYHQITWTLQKDGTVIQHWEIYDKNHNVLNSLFKGVYSKK
ncbi:MAG: hypothetical protein JXQ93_10645 [Flavobacteriaceae bacterium]